MPLYLVSTLMVYKEKAQLPEEEVEEDLFRLLGTTNGILKPKSTMIIG